MTEESQKQKYPDLKQWIPAFGPYFAIHDLYNKKPCAMSFNNYPLLSGAYAAYQSIATPATIIILKETLEHIIK
jgi:hypothetical protein